MLCERKFALNAMFSSSLKADPLAPHEVAPEGWEILKKSGVAAWVAAGEGRIQGNYTDTHVQAEPPTCTRKLLEANLSFEGSLLTVYYY